MRRWEEVYEGEEGWWSVWEVVRSGAGREECGAVSDMVRVCRGGGMRRRRLVRKAWCIERVD